MGETVGAGGKDVNGYLDPGRASASVGFDDFYKYKRDHRLTY
jgi:hypothetical protein